MSTMRITIEVDTSVAGEVMAQFIRQGATIQAVGLVESVKFNKNKPKLLKRKEKNEKKQVQGRTGSTPAVLEYLGGGPANLKQVTDKFGMTTKRAYAALYYLMKKGKVKKLKNGTYAGVV